MFEKLNEELIEAKERLRNKQKLERDLSRTRQDLIRQKSRLGELGAILQAEAADVSRLEGLSLTAIFYTVLGDKDQQLEKERQEYLAAKLKYDQCKSAVLTLEGEVSELKDRVSDLRSIDTQYASILSRKKELMAKSDSPIAKEYAELSEQLADIRPAIKELDEAINAGDRVLNALTDTIESLNSASNWGTWDMLGGGMIASYVKHSRIDDARSSIHYVQQLLRRFDRELADVNKDSQNDIDIQIGEFEMFADYFFDNLITDWIVQAKIARSLEKVLDLKSEVQSAMRDLHRRLSKLTGQASYIEKHRRRLIETA